MKKRNINRLISSGMISGLFMFLLCGSALRAQTTELTEDERNTIDSYKIGDTVTLTVARDGKERKIRITLVRSD
jgi:hypothetical protein